MKKLFIFIFTLVFICFITSGLNTKATTLETNELITIQGAQIRTSGNIGIRFVGKVDTNYSEEVEAYGICIAFGQATTENLYLGQSVNDKNVLAAQVSSVDENNCFYITLIDIPETMYNQKVTARSYVKTTSGEYIYSASVVTRSFYKTVKAVYEAGNNSEYIKQIYDSIPEYTFNFEPDFKFNVSSYNKVTNDVVNGYDMVILSKDVETTKQIMNVYWNSFAIAKTETENVYKVVYTLPEGLKTNMIPAGIEYDYVIGGHYNCLDNAGFKTVRRISELTNATDYYVYVDLPDAASEVELEVIVEDDYELLASNAIYLDKEDQLPSITKAHYIFNGWCTDEELSSDVVETHNGANNYYPKFTPKTYTITYHLNGGSCSADLVEEYTVESGVISLPTSQQMSKEGHTFGGWYRTSSLNSTDISAALRTSITSIDSYYGNNLNVYARWILDVDYNISLTTADTNALNNKAATIIVNSNLSSLSNGATVGVGDAKYVYGTSAFATITEALAKAEAGANIYVFAGTYAESLTISTANITIYGPNYGVNGSSTRNSEAIISQAMNIAASGFTLNGINFTGKQIKVTASISNLTIDNVLSTGVGAALNGGRTAVIGGDSSYSVNGLNIKNSKFTVKCTSGINVIAFYGKVTNMNIHNNMFTNGASASGALNETIRANSVAGTINVSNNTITWASTNFTITFGGSANTCTQIDIKDNVISGGTYSNSGVYVANVKSTCVVNIVGNKYNKVSGNIYNFTGSASGSKVNIMYNAYDANTAYKLTTTGSATITYTKNYYAATQTTSTSDYGVITSLEALETAYAAYKNQ